MSEHVSFEIFTAEVFEAHFTLMGLHSRVDEHVYLEIPTLKKGFTAHFTFMVLLSRVAA